MAKRLLKSKGVDMHVIDLTFDPDTRRTMSKKSGGATSVPQIFIGDTHVGGCDDLHALEKRGALDPMLAAG